ncbi:MAG: MaoC/PaaZ C-terminal domain-containing protein [Promethearchaeota archaeon]|jgi:acyl dehydratase
MSKNQLKFTELNEGLELPKVKSAPLSRIQLVDYAAASGDYNLLHYDESFAKKTGLKGCIAHGMLQMGMMGSYLLNWAKGGTLKTFKIRYLSPANENDVLTFTGKIVKKYQENNENLINITFISENQEKTITAQGSAVFSF